MKQLEKKHFESREVMFDYLGKQRDNTSFDVACYLNDRKEADFYGVEKLSFLISVLEQTNYNNFDVVIFEQDEADED